MKFDKSDLENLANLARIDLESAGEEKKLLQSIQEILAYVEELNEIETESVLTMDGGTSEKNIFRVDEVIEKKPSEKENIKNNFPKKEGDYLEVPAVFE